MRVFAVRVKPKHVQRPGTPENFMEPPCLAVAKHVYIPTTLRDSESNTPVDTLDTLEGSAIESAASNCVPHCSLMAVACNAKAVEMLTPHISTCVPACTSVIYILLVSGFFVRVFPTVLGPFLTCDGAGLYCFDC